MTHGPVIVVSRAVDGGAEIALASFADGFFVATAEGDDPDDVDDVVTLCQRCFVSERPEVSFILQAARERGAWRAGD